MVRRKKDKPINIGAFLSPSKARRRRRSRKSAIGLVAVTAGLGAFVGSSFGPPGAIIGGSLGAVASEVQLIRERRRPKRRRK